MSNGEVWLIKYKKHLAISGITSILLFLMLVPIFAIHRDIPPQTIEYYVDSSMRGIERELLVDAATRAAAMWAGENPGLDFVMTDGPDALRITTHVPWYVDFFVYQVAEDPAIGFAACPIWDANASHCTVYVNPFLTHEDTAGLPPETRANIVAHEIGHVLGLSHYPDSMANHLMGSSHLGRILESYDTKGYVVPEPLKP